MINQTLVGIPANFENFKQIRIFLLRLIERLDIVLGYRSTEGYASAAEVTSVITATKEDLITLKEATEQSLDSIDTLLETLETTLSDLSDAFNTFVEVIQAGTVITDINYTAPTIGATYSQAEVQGVADSVEDVSDKVDELLNILRTAGIVS